MGPSISNGAYINETKIMNHHLQGEVFGNKKTTPESG